LMTYDSVTAGDFLKGDSDPLLVVTSNPSEQIELSFIHHLYQVIFHQMMVMG